jgi:hypothetical protein
MSDEKQGADLAQTMVKIRLWKVDDWNGISNEILGVD